MVDRPIVYDGALPQTTDFLNVGKFGMQGLGWALQAILGGNIQVAGLACVPTVPNSLNVTVGPGTIYAPDETDATAYGDLGIDATVIIKEGILNEPVTLTITPPSTAGWSQVYLIEAILFDQDTGEQVLPYFNSNNPAEPFSGPDNDGLPNFTIRQTTCAIALKAGVAAPTGTETVPAPDAGYVGLYSIDVPNGLSQINSTFISPLLTAPRFPTLPAVPGDVQNSIWTFAIDTGVANAYTAEVATQDRQPLTALTPGTTVFLKVAHANTGASTFNLNGIGAINITRQTGAALSAGDMPAGGIAQLMYDGTNFQLVNFQGASTTGSNVFNTINIPYATDTGTPNVYSGTFSPAITSLAAGLVVILDIAHNNTGASTMQCNATAAKTLVDLYGNALTANVLQAGETAMMIYDGTVFRLMYVTSSQAAPTLQVFTSSGTYTPTTGKTKALMIVTGGGGAGGSDNGASCNCASAGTGAVTAISLVSLVGLGAQVVTVGAPGAPVSTGAAAGTPAGSGGQSSVGSLVVASGGLGGLCNINDKVPYPVNPQGTPTGTGQLVIPGGVGSPPEGESNHHFASVGGGSFWGPCGGVGGNDDSSNNVTYPALGFGCGGGAGGTQQQGSAGSKGVVFILEF